MPYPWFDCNPKWKPKTPKCPVCHKFMALDSQDPYTFMRFHCTCCSNHKRGHIYRVFIKYGCRWVEFFNKKFTGGKTCK